MLFAACATSTPRPMLPPFNTADQDVFGGWIVAVPVEPKAPRIAGELIAVAPERLVVLTPSGAVQVEKKDVKTASLALYDPKTILGNVTGGMLLSLTNGWLAAVTIPLWGVAGGIALHDVNVAAAIDYPESTWDALRKGARFPQGLPERFDIQNLQRRVPPAATK
ncbi:MAG: hypothetical protein ACXW3E_01845 [Thermoanaerobaculia bacterium]